MKTITENTMKVPWKMGSLRAIGVILVLDTRISSGLKELNNEMILFIDFDII